MTHRIVLNPLKSAWLLCLAWSFQAGAFDANKMEDFKTTNVCKYCDLTDAPLSGRDVSE